jgi:hypothetical protein
MPKLEVGDKYLSVSILGSINTACFKTEKKKDTDPDYKGDGIAIWIKQKKAPVEKVTDTGL